MPPKILSLDIETSPHKVYTFELWDANISIEKIIDPSRILCFGAKWLGVSKVHWHRGPEMLEKAHALLDEADVVMTYNGARFDIPRLNAEFVEYGFKPPSPYRQIDLYQTVKRQFKFASGKLAYVSELLGLEGKVKHEGFELWIKCMEDDPDAWKRMKRYNKRDVVLLEELYSLLQPWIVSHPSLAAFSGEHVCPACGSTNLQSRGYTYTTVSRFQRFWCNPAVGGCGKYSRATHRDYGADVTGVAS